jgi:hypothetical protein
MTDRATDDAPCRLELHGHVDEPAVAWARDALRADRGPWVLDLARTRSWDRDAVTAMTAVLDRPRPGLVVVAPRASSFLTVLHEAGLRQVWTVYDEVRRLRLAAERRVPRPAASAGAEHPV